MERIGMLVSLALVLVEEGRASLRSVVLRRERAQGTVEYGAAMLGIAAAAVALWLLFGPALGQLGERMVGQVNSIK